MVQMLANALVVIIFAKRTCIISTPLYTLNVHNAMCKSYITRHN